MIKTIIICDRCETYININQAVGWIKYKGKDLCENCSKERKEYLVEFQK
jgi:hypothetical protein